MNRFCILFFLYCKYSLWKWFLIENKGTFVITLVKCNLY